MPITLSVSFVLKREPVTSTPSIKQKRSVATGGDRSSLMDPRGQVPSQVSGELNFHHGSIVRLEFHWKE
jgi:hypothetical protein